MKHTACLIPFVELVVIRDICPLNYMDNQGATK